MMTSMSSLGTFHGFLFVVVVFFSMSCHYWMIKKNYDVINSLLMMLDLQFHIYIFYTKN